MTVHAAHHPLIAAAQIQGMAGKAGDEKAAQLLTGLSILMIAAMLFRECRDLLPGQPQRSWRERIDRERDSREHHR